MDRNSSFYRLKSLTRTNALTYYIFLLRFPFLCRCFIWKKEKKTEICFNLVWDSEIPTAHTHLHVNIINIDRNNIWTKQYIHRLVYVFTLKFVMNFNEKKREETKNICVWRVVFASCFKSPLRSSWYWKTHHQQQFIYFFLSAKR